MANYFRNENFEIFNLKKKVLDINRKILKTKILIKKLIIMFLR